MHKDPSHCEAPPNAAAVAQQGPHVGQPHTIRCTSRTRGGVRGQELQEIRGAGDVPEPPRIQESSSPSRRGIRVHPPWPACHSLRRIALRGSSPLHFPIGLGQLHPLSQSRGLSEILPRRHPE